MHFYTSDNLCIGSSLERRGRRQVCHLVQKQAAWHLASSVPGLWKKTRQAASFHSNTPEARYLLRSHIHFQVREKFSPLWLPSLEAAGFLQCPSYSANQGGVESAGEAFSIHFSQPVICGDLRDRVFSICQSSRDNLPGELSFRVLSNLGWQQSVGIVLASVKEKKTRDCSAFVAMLFPTILSNIKRMNAVKSNCTQFYCPLRSKLLSYSIKIDKAFHLKVFPFIYPVVYQIIEILYFYIIVRTLEKTFVSLTSFAKTTNSYDSIHSSLLPCAQNSHHSHSVSHSNLRVNHTLRSL